MWSVSLQTLCLQCHNLTFGIEASYQQTTVLTAEGWETINKNAEARTDWQINLTHLDILCAVQKNSKLKAARPKDGWMGL